MKSIEERFQVMLERTRQHPLHPDVIELARVFFMAGALHFRSAQNEVQAIEDDTESFDAYCVLEKEMTGIAQGYLRDEFAQPMRADAVAEPRLRM